MGRGKTVVLGLLMIHKLETRILFFFFWSIWIFRFFYNEYVLLTVPKQVNATSSIFHSLGKGRQERGRREGKGGENKRGREVRRHRERRKGGCSKLCFP